MKKLTTILIGSIFTLAPVLVGAHVVAEDPVHTGGKDEGFVSSLSLGSKGAEVTALQRLLRGLNNIYPEGLVTGYYGALTERAVKRLQRIHGLEIVGRVGPKTRALLNQIVSSGQTDQYGYLIPQINQISATSAGPNHLYIFWTTNKHTTSELYYSTQTPLASTTPIIISDVNRSLSHSHNIYNLATGTTYYYMIKVTDQFNVSATSTERSIQTLSQ